MNWTITDNDILLRDFSGVEGLIDRMDRELRHGGTPIEGFRFLCDAMAMLSYSREIEKEVLNIPSGADLYAGFQTAERFNGEAERYRRIMRAGVKVSAYGQCSPDPLP